MEQTSRENGVGESAGVFVFQSCPRLALTRTQERLAFWSLAALCFATAIGFVLLGYWPILPFAGLEVGVLAWAFRALRSREGDYETLTIDGDTVVLEWHAGPPRERRGGRRDGRRKGPREDEAQEGSAPAGAGEQPVGGSGLRGREAPRTGRRVARRFGRDPGRGEVRSARVSNVVGVTGLVRGTGGPGGANP
jgi:hypothetical protein